MDKNKLILKYLIILISVFGLSMTYGAKTTDQTIQYFEFRKKDTLYKVEGFIYKNLKTNLDFDLNTKLNYLDRTKMKEFKLRSTRVQNLEDEMIILHGKIKFFDRGSKSLIKEENYYFGSLSGRTIYYYKNGEIMKTENYDKGRKNGYFLEYDKEGNILLKELYTKDVLTHKFI